MASPPQEPALLHRSLTHRPHEVVSASGSYLHLSDGRTILDACGGAAVSILGHGNPEVIAATLTQMQKASYVHTGSYTTRSAEDLARIVLSPHSDFSHGLTKAFFVGSGSEANDAAMKCARQCWYEKGECERKWFVARQQGYHGNTIGAMSVSSVLGRKVPYEDILMENVSFVGPADGFHGRREGETESRFVERLVREAEEEFLRVGPETVISFM
jgi:adenosylmethionine-8-amino-7-oxononanoate aminotransferase